MEMLVFDGYLGLQAFELPRATKFPHKDFPPLPEFRSDSPPLMTFSDGNEDVFRARLTSKDACIQRVTSFEEDMVYICIIHAYFMLSPYYIL